MKKITTFFLSILLIFLIGIVQAQEETDKPSLLLKKNFKAVISDLETDIPDLMGKARIPGLQIAVIRDGKVVWQKGFGFKNATTRVPVTNETIFLAASLTKPLFAYAVMMMVDEGLIDLDKPLHTYLTRQKIEKELGNSLDAKGFKRDWFEKVTGRHVLSHSGGLPHGERGEVFPIFFKPGTQWKYSAEGYILLQFVVEKLKGKKLDKIILEYILDPLGMKKSCMVWRDTYVGTMANGHNAFSKPRDFLKETKAYASYSLYTTAGEYARFICAILNGERLKRETWKEMLTSFIDMNEEKSLGWSLGFGLQHDSNGTALWQWGSVGIFRNFIIAYPEQKTGVVYLTNSFNGLSICSEVVGRSIGGRTLWKLHHYFDMYRTYNAPYYKLVWGVKDGGIDTVQSLIPELRKKYPEKLSWETIGKAANYFQNEKMYSEAIAIKEYIFKTNPTSGQEAFNLAQSYLLNSDLKSAKVYYLKANEAEKDKVDLEDIDWILDYIQAVQNPFPLNETHMQKLAGDYQVRHITIKDGRLYYFRDGGNAPDARPLFALSKDTFFIKGVTRVRIKVEFDDQDDPIKLVLQYKNGRRDESKRTRRLIK